MNGIQVARNGGLIVATLGVVVGLVGYFANTSDAGTGANIGAGILMLAGIALVLAGAIAAAVFAAIGRNRK